MMRYSTDRISNTYAQSNIIQLNIKNIIVTRESGISNIRQGNISYRSNNRQTKGPKQLDYVLQQTEQRACHYGATIYIGPSTPLPDAIEFRCLRRIGMMFQRSPSTGREQISSICGGWVVSPNYIVSSRRLAAPRGIRPVVTVIKKTDANCRYASCTQFHAPASQRTV